jgi:chromosome segregation ATPase
MLGQRGKGGGETSADGGVTLRWVGRGDNGEGSPVGWWPESRGICKKCRMNSLIGQHPWGALLVTLLLGMVVKWLLDLFFLRSEMFGLRRRLTDRERDLTDLRHEHGRSLQELKNRLTELDATAKAKMVVSSTLAAREVELIELRERERHGVLRADAAEGKLVLAVQEASSAKARMEELAFRCSQAEELGKQLEAGAAQHEADAAVLNSVRDALEAAVRDRDRSISELASSVSELGVRIEAQLETSAVARVATEQATLELVEVRQRFESEERLRQALESDLRGVRTQLEAATRAKAVADANLKRREMELAENEQRSGEMQRGMEEAAREAARLSAENSRLQGEVGRLTSAAAVNRTTDAASRAAELERARLADEVKALRSDLEAQSRLRSGLEAVAKAQEAAVNELRLQVSAATSQRRALEAELEAVSASHAALESRLASVAAPAEDGDDRLKGALADLEEMTAERNRLSAELAVLRSEQSKGDA